MLKRSRCCQLVAAVLLGLNFGCGGDNIVPVEGVLKHKGKPVPNARVTLYPDEGRPVSGLTDAQGQFKIRYDNKRDGAEIGNYKVVVEFVPGSNPEPGVTAAAPAELKTLFEKYSLGTSKHKVKIESATRDLKLDLD